MSERTAPAASTPARGVTITTDAVNYITRRFQEYYRLDSGNTSLPHSRVEAVRVTLQIDDGELGVQDLTNGTQSVYQRVGELKDGPFLGEPFVSTGTYDERGLVRYYVRGADRGRRGEEEQPHTQVAIVGLRSKDGQTVIEHERDRLGFVRIYDFLGESLPAPEDLPTLLYSRGGALKGSPALQPELVLDAGAPARLLGRRPANVPENAHAAVAYISELGAAYHAAIEDPFSPTPPQGQWLRVCFTHGYYTEENAQVTVEFSEDFVTGIYQRLPFNEVKFLNGYLRFYSFLYNPDPREPSKPVNRITVVGLTHEHKLGFVRLFDSLGLPVPAEELEPLSFEFFTSHFNNGYGFLNRELVSEIGSPTALIAERF